MWVKNWIRALISQVHGRNRYQVARTRGTPPACLRLGMQKAGYHCSVSRARPPEGTACEQHLAGASRRLVSFGWSLPSNSEAVGPFTIQIDALGCGVAGMSLQAPQLPLGRYWRLGAPHEPKASFSCRFLLERDIESLQQTAGRFWACCSSVWCLSCGTGQRCVVTLVRKGLLGFSFKFKLLSQAKANRGELRGGLTGGVLEHGACVEVVESPCVSWSAGARNNSSHARVDKVQKPQYLPTWQNCIGFTLNLRTA